MRYLTILALLLVGGCAMSRDEILSASYAKSGAYKGDPAEIAECIVEHFNSEKWTMLNPIATFPNATIRPYKAKNLTEVIYNNGPSVIWVVHLHNDGRYKVSGYSESFSDRAYGALTKCSH